MASKFELTPDGYAVTEDMRGPISKSHTVTYGLDLTEYKVDDGPWINCLPADVAYFEENYRQHFVPSAALRRPHE